MGLWPERRPSVLSELGSSRGVRGRQAHSPSCADVLLRSENYHDHEAMLFSFFSFLLAFKYEMFHVHKVLKDSYKHS